METKDIELEKMSKVEKLCLEAFIESHKKLEKIQETIDNLEKSDDTIIENVYGMVKSLHENYGNTLACILAELPTFKKLLIKKEMRDKIVDLKRKEDRMTESHSKII